MVTRHGSITAGVRSIGRQATLGVVALELSVPSHQLANTSQGDQYRTIERAHLRFGHLFRRVNPLTDMATKHTMLLQTGGEALLSKFRFNGSQAECG